MSKTIEHVLSQAGPEGTSIYKTMYEQAKEQDRKHLAQLAIAREALTKECYCDDNGPETCDACRALAKIDIKPLAVVEVYCSQYSIHDRWQIKDGVSWDGSKKATMVVWPDKPKNFIPQYPPDDLECQDCGLVFTPEGGIECPACGGTNSSVKPEPSTEGD